MMGRNATGNITAAGVSQSWGRLIFTRKPSARKDRKRKVIEGVVQEGSLKPFLTDPVRMAMDG